MSRSICLDCRRPATLCICAEVTQIANRTRVSLLQHPRERRHPFNTARLTARVLDRCTLEIPWDIAMAPPDDLTQMALLFPHERAEVIGADTPPPETLWVLDGTWPQARSLYRSNPWMSKLRHLALAPEHPSAYAIRREPAAHCLSTIESVHAALTYFEPDTPGLDWMLDPFHAMVRGQVEHRSAGGARPRVVKKGKEARLATLQRRWSSAVCVYAETSPVRRSEPGTQVLQLTAVRMATNETFDHIGEVDVMPNPCVLEHMGLDPDDARNAAPQNQLAAAWQRFRRPGDILLAWSHGSATVAMAAVGDPDPVLPLKSMYCDRVRGPTGRPDQLLARESVSSESVPVRGRASERLGYAAALAGWLERQR